MGTLMRGVRPPDPAAFVRILGLPVSPGLSKYCDSTNHGRAT